MISFVVEFTEKEMAAVERALLTQVQVIETVIDGTTGPTYDQMHANHTDSLSALKKVIHT